MFNTIQHNAYLYAYCINLFMCTQSHIYLIRKCNKRPDWSSALNLWFGLYQHEDAGSYRANKAWQTGVIPEEGRKHFRWLRAKKIQAFTGTHTQTYPQSLLRRWWDLQQSPRPPCKTGSALLLWSRTETHGPQDPHTVLWTCELWIFLNALVETLYIELRSWVNNI